MRILRGEIEHFLHDPRYGFSMPIGYSEQAEIIAFTQKRVRGSHVTARNHGAPPDGHQVNDHQHDEKNRQQKQRNHHRTGFEKRLHDGLRMLGNQRRSRLLCKQRRRARQRGKQHNPNLHAGNFVMIGGANRRRKCWSGSFE